MQKRNKPFLSGSSLVLIILLFLFSFYYLSNRDSSARELTYGELMQVLQADDPALRLQNVKVRKTLIRGEMVTTDPVSRGIAAPETKEVTRSFRTPIGLASDAEMLKLIRARAGGSFEGAEEDALASVVQMLLSFAMIFVMVLGGFFLFRWIAGGSSPLSVGRSRHRIYADKDLKTTFEDVAGIDEAVAELREVVDFLKNPDKYQVLGGRIPKGVLLVGPPGTGKTLLARAVAGEADVPFFSMSGSDFVEMFVGVGASRVRDVFSQAESRAPCIIFIDELDALGKARGVSAIGGHDEREQTLNQLLVEMDGFDSNRGVIIMAATNRPETLDSALLRPGRFDRTVVVDRPDIVGREAILKVHVRHVKLAENVNLRKVAALTPGSVGADLANIVNEAALIAARSNETAVDKHAFDEAIERGQAGLERKSRIMHADEKQRVAYHEAGHAIVSVALPNTDPVHKVSIIPRGLALGYVLRRPEDDRYLTTQSELESHIKCALGGTIAEELIYGEISSGATSDLEKANQIACRMVKEFGMSKLGRVSYRDPGSPFLNNGGQDSERYSETTAREIDMEVRRIIDESTDEVRLILRTRRAALEALAKLLVEKEVVDSEVLRHLIEEHLPGPKLVPASSRAGGIEDDEYDDEDEGEDVQARENLGK